MWALEFSTVTIEFAPCTMTNWSCYCWSHLTPPNTGTKKTCKTKTQIYSDAATANAQPAYLVQRRSYASKFWPDWLAVSSVHRFQGRIPLQPTQYVQGCKACLSFVSLHPKRMCPKESRTSQTTSAPSWIRHSPPGATPHSTPMGNAMGWFWIIGFGPFGCWIFFGTKSHGRSVKFVFWEDIIHWSMKNWGSFIQVLKVSSYRGPSPRRKILGSTWYTS